MNRQLQLEKILFLDIETVPQAYRFDQLDDKSKVLFEAKNRFQISPDKSIEQIFDERGGILAEFQALAEKEYSEIKREGFMLYKTSEQAAFKKLDGGAPSLDMSSLNFFASHTYL
jgi:hypothetical protein